MQILANWTWLEAIECKFKPFECKFEAFERDSIIQMKIQTIPKKFYPFETKF